MKAPKKHAAAKKKKKTTKRVHKAHVVPVCPPDGVDKKGRGTSVTSLRVREIESLREEVERRSAELLPRWNANPEDVQRSVAQLVLSLVEFLRKLLERQAIRRMEAETLEDEEIEKIGLALMRLEETVHDLAAQFGLSPEELNLDLGPLGRLS